MYQLCLVINFFQQPFRKGSDTELGDADSINYKGDRIIMAHNAGDGGGVDQFMKQVDWLTHETFSLMLMRDPNAPSGTRLPGTQIRVKLDDIQGRLSQVDSVKIIITGHGEPGVPFIFDDANMRQARSSIPARKSCSTSTTRSSKAGLRSPPTCWTTSTPTTRSSCSTDDAPLRPRSQSSDRCILRLPIRDNSGLHTES